MMSASMVSPELSRMPSAVNASMVSVTTDALPSRMAVKKSPSGIRQIRCWPSGYAGVKCVSTSKPSGSALRASLMNHSRISSGFAARRSRISRDCFRISRRTISWVHSSGVSTDRSVSANSFTFGLAT
jgi:hypothetical protein